MEKDDIKLPPLPVAVPWHKGYDRKSLESYARAAVEADRQQRGEPHGHFIQGRQSCLYVPGKETPNFAVINGNDPVVSITALHAAPVAAQPAASAEPSGYAYRYPDGCIRFSNGREINGSKPIEAIPYWFAAPVAAQAQPVVNQQMTTAARDVLAERQRQVEAEGWTTEHDDSHHTGEMALAAGCYAMYAHQPDYYGTGPRERRVPRMWPWAEKW